MDNLFWENPDNTAIHYEEANEDECVEGDNVENDIFSQLEKSYLSETLREPIYD